MSASRRVLVAGGGGYLGAILVPKLVAHGHFVHVVDLGIFGADILEQLRACGANVTVHDLRAHETLTNLFDGIDCVVCLAGLSNDPSCDLDPTLTIELNYRMMVSLAQRAKHSGVRDFLFTSSCSVYGAAGDRWLDENSDTMPLTLYALLKQACEDRLLSLHDNRFHTTSFRLATLFGYSPRMRFDLAVNAMVRQGLIGSDLVINGDGQQYRPFVHIEDAADVLATVVDEGLPDSSCRLVNLGSTANNLKVCELATLVAAKFPGVSIISNPNNSDPRSYRVGFHWLENLMPRFQFKSVVDGICDLRERFASPKNPGDLSEAKYYNLLVAKQYFSAPALPFSPATVP